jgi:carboxyl-terminal processing protease
VNRHTASAAEMIVAFARENNLARIVGEKTAGKLLSATSVKVARDSGWRCPPGPTTHGMAQFLKERLSSRRTG